MGRVGGHTNARFGAGKSQLAMTGNSLPESATADTQVEGLHRRGMNATLYCGRMSTSGSEQLERKRAHSGAGVRLSPIGTIALETHLKEE